MSVGIFLILISFLSALLILPGWILSTRRRFWSGWIFALPSAGVGFWLALAMLGLGAQGLGNVVEAFVVMASAVVVSYLMFFVFVRFHFTEARSMAIAYIAVAIIALCLRMFMPVRPEGMG